MKSARTVICILGAFIGAGFASGREVMQFFTRYGSLSVPLILLTGVLITGLIRSALCGGMLCPGGRKMLPRHAVMLLLFLTAGGGMAAAAGEIWALTIPLQKARSIGMLLSLALCLAASGKPDGTLSLLGCLLLPALLLALTLCMRVPEPADAPRAITPDASAVLRGVAGCFSYAGMNVMLALGILEKAGRGCSRRGCCRCAVWSGGAVTGLLLLFNQALLPHRDALLDAPLPIVQLLRAYGKEGYYLSAAVLYVAVVTTLIAVLRALREMAAPLRRLSVPLVGLSVAFVSLCGFERIVAVAYPVLGFFCFLLFLRPGSASLRESRARS